jgi:hypothetical protein
MKNTILLFLLLAFMSCQKKEDSYFFHGEIVIVDDIEKIDSLTGEWIELRGIYYGQMNVIDSLMIFTSTKQEKFISIFSVNTGNLVGTFCSKGGGPGEYISIADDGQLETSEGADIRLLLNAFNNNQLLWFNVSSSVARHQTCVDTTIPFGFIYSDGQVPFSSSFLLEEGIMAKRQETLDPPCKPTEYILYSVKDKEKLRTYPLYKDVITAKRRYLNTEYYLISNDRIKPDRTKIAMACGADLVKIAAMVHTP